MSWLGKLRGRGKRTPPPGTGVRPAYAPATEDTLRAGHEVLQLVGVGDKVPYDTFVERAHLDADGEPVDEPLTQGEVWRAVQRLMVDENRAFELDWKWGSPEDLLTTELPALIPGFTSTVERMDHIDGRWHFRCVVLGEPVEGVADDSIPHYFVDLINPVLRERAGVQLEYYTTGADSQCFLLAPADRAEELHTERYRGVFG
jgi:hypothetical protein